jgi:pantoate--beta-alanine ligase
MRLLTTAAELKEACRSAQRPVGLVPTMGALHDGHMSLVHQAGFDNATTIVTIFVNPAQFGSSEDLATYPRSLERDLALLEKAGVDIVFAPTVEEVYPPGDATFVQVQGPAMPLEGQARPGHFRGVATVVTKLLTLTFPDRAYFGWKDAQQLAVVQRLVRDLHFPTEIVALPTVRDSDGLAVSSRNVLLSANERAAAPIVYRALNAAQRLYRQGEHRDKSLLDACRGVLEQEPMVSLIDYVALVDPATFRRRRQLDDSASLLAVSVRIGSVRLIDNLVLEHEYGAPAADGSG